MPKDNKPKETEVFNLDRSFSELRTLKFFNEELNEVELKNSKQFGSKKQLGQTIGGRKKSYQPSMAFIQNTKSIHLF